MSITPYVPARGSDYATSTSLQSLPEKYQPFDSTEIMPRGIDREKVTYTPNDTSMGEFSDYNDADNNDDSYRFRGDKNRGTDKDPFENYVNDDVTRPMPAKEYNPTDMKPDSGCRPPLNIMTKTKTPLQIKYKVSGSDWQNLPSLQSMLTKYVNSKDASTASDIWTVNRKIKDRMVNKKIEAGKFEVQLIHLRTAESLCNNLSTRATSDDYFFGVTIYPGEEIESMNDDVGPGTAEGGKRRTRKHRKAKKSKKHIKSKSKSRRRRTYKKK